MFGRWVSTIVLAVLGTGAGLCALRRVQERARIAKAFEKFIVQHHKVYRSVEEKEYRFNIFKKNLALIEVENSKSNSYTLGVTPFADLSLDEFTRQHTGKTWQKPVRPFGDLPYLGAHEYSGKALPDSIDWVKKGAVTDVKNQKQCGSCWSFSTTGALEGAWEIATGKLVSLSEQQLVDCSKGGNMGCGGGSMDLAFAFLEKNDACTEDSYPYQAKNGKCHASNCTVGIPKGSVTGYKDVTTKSVEALQEAVAQQPVSVAIEADQSAFQLYTGGVLTAKCGTKLDHGVLLVGYGTDENGVDFWKVKNSWGPNWGEEGYIRLKRGMSKDGECGIQDGPVYPVVEKALGSKKTVSSAPISMAVKAQLGAWQLGMGMEVVV